MWPGSAGPRQTWRGNLRRGRDRLLTSEIQVVDDPCPQNILDTRCRLVAQRVIGPEVTFNCLTKFIHPCAGKFLCGIVEVSHISIATTVVTAIMHIMRKVVPRAAKHTAIRQLLYTPSTIVADALSLGISDNEAHIIVVVSIVATIIGVESRHPRRYFHWSCQHRKRC